jgi:hypothetical protein
MLPFAVDEITSQAMFSVPDSEPLPDKLTDEEMNMLMTEPGQGTLSAPERSVLLKEPESVEPDGQDPKARQGGYGSAKLSDYLLDVLPLEIGPDKLAPHLLNVFLSEPDPRNLANQELNAFWSEQTKDSLPDSELTMILNELDPNEFRTWN